VADQIVKTTLVVNGQLNGSDSIEKVLEGLITKAKELDSILNGLKFPDTSGLSGAGGRGRGGASGGSSVDQTQQGQGDGGTSGGAGGGGRKRRKGGASGGTSADGDDSDLTPEEKEKEDEDKRKAAAHKRRMQKMTYAGAVGVGMLARSISSRFTGYYEGTEGARAVEAAGIYSGDVFQMAQGIRQAQAMRQQAQLRNMSGWSWMGVGSSALQMAGTSVMMMGGLPGVLGGLALTGLGTAGQMIAGRQIATKGADIDTQTAKTMAAINTLQQIQNQTTQLVTLQRNTIAFGGERLGQNLETIRRGTKFGFAPTETQSMTNRFLAAGGRLEKDINGQTNPTLDFIKYQIYGNVSPETLGKFERGFYPGGGAKSFVTIPNYVPNPATLGIANSSTDNAKLSLNAITNAATYAGVPTARLDEWINRSSAYMQKYAERNVSASPFAQTDIMSYLPEGVKGFARQAGTENLADFGMSMADQLNEMVMPQELVRGLLFAKVAGQGGGPSDWKRKLADKSYMADAISQQMGMLPNMLKEPFMQATTGLLGVKKFKKGTSKATDVTAPPEIVSPPNAGQPQEIQDLAQKMAENQALYIQSLKDTSELMDEMGAAIKRAIVNLDKFDLQSLISP